jgi:hypothetical protein
MVVEDSIPAALVLAADGQLPALRLSETESEKAPEEKSRTINPLLLLTILCTSVVVSLALIFIDFGSEQGVDNPAKQRARYVIEQEYISDVDDPAPKERYQWLLREALRAYWRRDYQKERELYREVLNLLRQERPKNQSLTGSPGRDRRLQELLTILLTN